MFFFKQKTAYEMRISDWSSDVCSSDLAVLDLALGVAERRGHVQALDRTHGDRDFRTVDLAIDAGHEVEGTHLRPIPVEIDVVHRRTAVLIVVDELMEYQIRDPTAGSEERREWKEGVSTVGYRGEP